MRADRRKQMTHFSESKMSNHTKQYTVKLKKQQKGPEMEDERV